MVPRFEAPPPSLTEAKIGAHGLFYKDHGLCWPGSRCGTVTQPPAATPRPPAPADMMAEKDAAIDEYKRREQACQDKWEENPEVVPEECMCTEDIMEDSANQAQLTAPPARFGEDQASLGLDRYSVGYDLPLPPLLGAAAGGDPTAKVDRRGGGRNVMRVVEEVGDLIVETLADLAGDGEAELASATADGGAAMEVGGEDVADRNETSSAPPSSIPT